MIQPITHHGGGQYFEGEDYIYPHYADYNSTRGLQLIHANGTLTLSRCPSYPQWVYQFMQVKESTSAGWPVIHDPVLSQVNFDATFPMLTAEELAALRTFMFSTVPMMDDFELYDVGNNMSMQARFQNLDLKVKSFTRDMHEVIVSMARV